MGITRDSLNESLAIFRRRENQYEIADAIGTLGRLALLQGDLTQAHRYLQEAVTIATAFDHQGMLRNWPLWLGLVTLYSGDATEARRLLRETLRLCIEQQDKVPSARACTYLAETALWEGDLAQTEEWLAQSLAHYADPHKITIYEVERLWVVARLATTQQQFLHAAGLFGLAEQAHSQIHHAIGGPMRALADAALATVQTALEPAVFVEAFAIGQQMALAECVCHHSYASRRLASGVGRHHNGYAIMRRQVSLPARLEFRGGDAIDRRMSVAQLS